MSEIPDPAGTHVGQFAPGPSLVPFAAALWATVGPARSLPHDNPSAVVLSGWRQLLGAMVLLLIFAARGQSARLLSSLRQPSVPATGLCSWLWQHERPGLPWGVSTVV